MRGNKGARILVVVLFSILVACYAVAAQSDIATLIVYSIDVSGFPTIRVDIAPLSSAGDVPEDLTTSGFVLYEDGVQLPVTSAEVTEKGVQIAIVLDASGSINRPGATLRADGKAPLMRRDEAIRILDELVMTDKWIDTKKRLDWVMLIMPQGSDRYDVLQDWTNDYVPIHNLAYQYPYQEQKGDTPLFEMLVAAMSHMKDVNGYQHRPKFLLVLSDGIDTASDKEVQDVYIRANNLGVTILSLKLGPEGTGKAKNLKRLASETGGAFAAYTGPRSLSPLYRILHKQRLQYRLAYRSRISHAGKHTLQVAVAQGARETRSRPVEFGISIQPPQVHIVEPDHTVTLDPGGQEPRDLSVTFEVTWPDGHSRHIQNVSYIVDGTVLATMLPEEVFVWDLSQLAPGEHSLQVEVEDELGLVARSEPVLALVPNVLPPAVHILEPASGTVYQREPGQWYRRWFFDPRALEPRTQPVKIAIDWPDGNPRAVQSVSYIVDGNYLATLPPDASFVWDFSDLKAGTHWLQVDVIDELGLQSKSEPVEASIVLPRPPSVLTLLSLAVAGLSLMLATYVLIKRPQVAVAAATTIMGVMKEITEPFRPTRAMASRHQSSALLIPVDESGSRGEPRTIVAQTIRLGRDPALADLIFPDRTVSRLHARIVEESDDVFKIYDEGSRSGTYVNYELVPIGGRQLRTGDEIQMGRVRIVFQVKAGGAGDATQPFLSSMGDRTGVQSSSPSASSPEHGDPDETRPFNG